MSYYEGTMRMLVTKICPPRVPVEIQDLIVERLLYMQYRQKAALAFDFICLNPKHLTLKATYHFDPQLVGRKHIGTILHFDKANVETFTKLKTLAQQYFLAPRGQDNFLPRPLCLLAVVDEAESHNSIANEARRVSDAEAAELAKQLGCDYAVFTKSSPEQWFELVCGTLFFMRKNLDQEFVRRMDAIKAEHPYNTWTWRTRDRYDHATKAISNG